MSVNENRPDRAPLIAQASASFAARARWNVLEVAFWLAALASIFLLPSKHLILTEIAILALFALSLDLILGYAGIVSLGHAAFFGFGAYVAGILAKYGIVKEPVLALMVSGLAAMVLGFVTSFLVLRGSDLTRLMVTLGVALVLREIANRLDITGGADGLQGIVMEPVLGHFAVRYLRQDRLRLQPDRAVHPVPDRAPHRQFAVRAFAALGARQSAARLGDRHSCQWPPRRDLYHRGRLRRRRRRTADAGDAIRLALGARLRALRRRDADADHRRHRLSLRRA